LIRHLSPRLAVKQQQFVAGQNRGSAAGDDRSAGFGGTRAVTGRHRRPQALTEHKLNGLMAQAACADGVT
jgi:hypothetical protein